MIILVTGGNSGIGYETLRQVGKSDKRAILLLGHRDTERGSEAEESLKKEGIKVSPIEIDVTSDTSIEKAKALVESRFGKLDILVNNAGIQARTYTREQFLTTYNTNVAGVGILLDKFESLLLKSEDPKVLNVSSTLGSFHDVIHSEFPNFYLFPIYNCTKAALNMLTATFSRRWEGKIKIISVSPGYTATKLTNHSGISPIDKSVLPIVTAVFNDFKSGSFYVQDNTDQPLTEIPW